MTIDWINIIITVLTAGFFSIIGFVWRYSHKVTKQEQEIHSLRGRISKMESDHDKVLDRMYSIAKDRSGYMTRESYRHDKEMERALLDAKIKSNSINISKDTMK
mgnify:CR=1 FL=1|jgi:hypothetical protein